MEEAKSETTTFIEELRKAKEQENKDIDYILNNPLYMDGLVQKICKNDYVFENDREDSEYNKLALLYKIIDRYAKDNGLSPIVYTNYSLYYIEYNNHTFSVFRKIKDKQVGYGCYINYLDKKKLPYYIKFEDIKNNKVISIDNFTSGLVSELKDIIDELHCEGFPLYFIHQLVDNMIASLSEKEEEKLR